MEMGPYIFGCKEVWVVTLGRCPERPAPPPQGTVRKGCLFLIIRHGPGWWSKGLRRRCLEGSWTAVQMPMHGWDLLLATHCPEESSLQRRHPREQPYCTTVGSDAATANTEGKRHSTPWGWDINTPLCTKSIDCMTLFFFLTSH